MEVKKEPPAEWGILAGDFAQNARAALDHTIHQVALLSVKRPKPVFFPIAVTPDEYVSLKPCDMPSLRDQALAGIPESHRALVDELQPHAGGKSREVAEGDPLAVLNAFSNADKHRVIHAAAIAPKRVSAIPEVGDPKITITLPAKRKRAKVLTDGAQIYTIIIDRPSEAEVRVNIGFTYAIGFGPRGVTDADMLNLADYVGNIIARFRPLFD